MFVIIVDLNTILLEKIEQLLFDYHDNKASAGGALIKPIKLDRVHW